MTLNRESLRVKIFVDCADLETIRRMALLPWVAGFTTNPTLMRQAGVTDYARYGPKASQAAAGKPISFEVVADDLGEMKRQATVMELAWGTNAVVKIPISTTAGESTLPLVRSLTARGQSINVTAVMTLTQIRQASDAQVLAEPFYISVFAGRIADTGRDPIPIVSAGLELIRPYPWQHLIWASTREVWNVAQADALGCDIITVTPALFAKLPQLGKDVTQLSRETVQMFHDDAQAAGLTL